MQEGSTTSIYVINLFVRSIRHQRRKLFFLLLIVKTKITRKAIYQLCHFIGKGENTEWWWWTLLGALGLLLAVLQVDNGQLRQQVYIA